MQVLATASPFAFGPVGTALCLLKALRRRDVDVTFVGSGAAFELASLEPGLTCHELTGRPVQDAAEIRARSLGADVVVSVMEGDLLASAAGVGARTAWVDTLASFEAFEPHPASLSAGLYVHQTSLPDWPGLTDLRQKVSGRFVAVGPIVPAPPADRPPEADYALVSLGGLRLPTTWSDDVYAASVGSLMQFLGHLETRVDCRLVVVGGSEGFRLASRRFRSLLGEIRTVPFPEFRDLLEGARALLTPPGLNAPLAAWASGIPVLFLPPTNPSQVVQLEAFLRLGVLQRGPGPGLSLPRWYDGRLVEVLRSFADPPTMQSLADAFERCLGEPESLLALTEAGRGFIDSVGGIGTEDAAEAIVDLAAS